MLVIRSVKRVRPRALNFEGSLPLLPHPASGSQPQKDESREPQENSRNMIGVYLPGSLNSHCIPTVRLRFSTLGSSFKRWTAFAKVPEKPVAMVVEEKKARPGALPVPSTEMEREYLWLGAQKRPHQHEELIFWFSGPIFANSRNHAF